MEIGRNHSETLWRRRPLQPPPTSGPSLNASPSVPWPSRSTRKRRLRVITRRSPVDGRPFDASRCRSSARRSRRMRGGVRLRLVAVQRAQNSGNCDRRRRHFQDVVAGFGSGFASFSATGCVTTDARGSLKYSRVDMGGGAPVAIRLRCCCCAVTLPTSSFWCAAWAEQATLNPAYYRAPAAASVGRQWLRRQLHWHFSMHVCIGAMDWLGKCGMNANNHRLHCLDVLYCISPT